MRVSEHMSKKCGRSASAWTDSSAHRPVALATTRRPSSTSRSSMASSITVWVTSANTCCTNRQASSVCGAQALPILSMVRHSLIMDVVSMPDSRESLTARKQKATRARIAAAAAQTVAENGLSTATVEQIAAAAEIGRATFFRYFNSKEDAVAEGMTKHWLDLITAAIARQPEHLSAVDAVMAAFGGLGDGFEAISEQVRELATLTRSSP